MGTLRGNMAKKSKAPKRRTVADKKIGTTAGATQRKMQLAQLTVGAANPTNLIQVDRCLNNANRRLYRQHKVYRAKVSLSNTNVDNVTAPCEVYALRNTWQTRKAMSLAKEIYDLAVKEERAVVGSSRWHDFRISPQFEDGAGYPLVYPLGISGQGMVPLTEGSAADGEYEYSAVETTDAAGAAVSFQFGTRTNTVGNLYSIWDEYQKMGPTTTEDPLFVSPGGYDRATGDSFETENVEDLLNKGNLPPYNAGTLGLQSSNGGGAWVKVGQIGRGTGATGSLKLSTEYFDAPLGLIVVRTAPFAYSNGEAIELGTQTLELEVQSGDYKGVMAHDI